MKKPGGIPTSLGDRVSLRFAQGTRWLERVLALLVLVGVVMSAIGSGRTLMAMDWGTTDAFYEFVYRVLLLVIGLELVRMLVTHELRAVLELLAFVIARKMLKPDLTAVDIVLSVLAFVALLAAGHWLLVARPAAEPRLPTQSDT